jgi:D-alanine-D-alanine ligase
MTEPLSAAPPLTSNGLEMPKTVGIIYSEVRREYFPTETQYLTEKNAEHEAQVIGSYLEKMNIGVHYYPGTPNLVIRLAEDNPDMVINLAGSIIGQEYLSSTIPGILESLEIPYTGAGILGESLTYNKFLVKELLQSHGIPVPRFQLMPNASVPLDPTLQFPLISKLNEIHGAVEITDAAVSENEKHLRERLKFLINTYKQPVLVEEFIAGREMTAILLEGLNKKVYLAEKVFQKQDQKYVFATFNDQWTEEGANNYRYEKYQDPTLSEYVKRAFDILRMSDYGKFDIRIDQSGRYYFIDSNSNPAFGPKELDIAIANILDLYGISFVEILKRLLLNTMRDAAGTERLNLTPDIPGEQNR